jgi:hydroxymethylpyrimidine/phosphomethylpyrimidine kinase
MALTDMPCSSFEEKESAANSLFDLRAKAVLVKGGHEEGNKKTDILFSLSNGNLQQTLFTSETICTQNIHGTGCTLSAAITAFLARGLCLDEAIAEAKNFITEAIRSGADVAIGHGHGPVNHNFNPMKMLIKEHI